MNSDRRRATRHPIVLDIVFGLHGTAPKSRGRSVDVSRTGLFIMTDAVFAEGKRVDLIINGTDGKAPLLASGTVIHSVAELGIGVRFSEQTDMARKRLQQLIEAFYERHDDFEDDEDTAQSEVPAEFMEATSSGVLTREREKSDREPTRKG
ncbi:MAG: PilZ domain-containing protein [Clostridia bacterium]|nr:PilZ domain-containing protein [Deltaproteobacteria bacterium]